MFLWHIRCQFCVCSLIKSDLFAIPDFVPDFIHSIYCHGDLLFFYCIANFPSYIWTKKSHFETGLGLHINRVEYGETKTCFLWRPRSIICHKYLCFCIFHHRLPSTAILDIHIHTTSRVVQAAKNLPWGCLATTYNRYERNEQLPGCICPRTFSLNIGLSMFPLDSFMSCLHSLLGYSTGEFQALQLIVLAAFAAVD